MKMLYATVLCYWLHQKLEITFVQWLPSLQNTVCKLQNFPLFLVLKKLLFTVRWISFALVMSQLLHIHGKFTLESYILHFMESRFTSILNCEILSTPYSHHFGNFTRNQPKICYFSLKIPKNNKICHNGISRLQMVKSLITFMLDSHKFWSRFITSMWYNLLVGGFS